AREIDVDAVLEGDDDLREAERRDRPLDEHVRRADQGPLDRDGDLPLHVLGGLPRIERDDHDLDVRHVRERLDLELGEGVDAERDEADAHQQHGDATTDGELDEGLEHGGASSGTSSVPSARNLGTMAACGTTSESAWNARATGRRSR